MNEDKTFELPEELLAFASGGASGTILTGNTAEALQKGTCPYCGGAVTLLSQTGQQAGTGNIISMYACIPCNRFFQKILYLDGHVLWGEIHL